MQQTKKHAAQELLIVGLGNNVGHNNPYKNTKHNIGMEAVYSFLCTLKTTQAAALLECPTSFEKQENYEVVKISPLRCTLLVPRLYMNENGKALGNFMRAQRLSGSSFLEKFKLLIVHDELDLALGRTKIKSGGSAKGHNGVKSVIQQLGGFYKFDRLQIGIDRPASRDPKQVANYVLSGFADGDAKDRIVHLAGSDIQGWIQKQ